MLPSLYSVLRKRKQGKQDLNVFGRIQGALRNCIYLGFRDIGTKRGPQHNRVIASSTPQKLQKLQASYPLPTHSFQLWPPLPRRCSVRSHANACKPRLLGFSGNRAASQNTFNEVCHNLVSKESRGSYTLSHTCAISTHVTPPTHTTCIRTICLCTCA